MEEGLSLGKLAVLVLVLVIVIFVIMMFVRMGKSETDKGADKLAATFGQLEAQEFSSYDNKTVTGTVLSAALDTFKGKPVAIWIKTKAGTNQNYLAKTDGTPSDPGTEGSIRDINLVEDWEAAGNYNTNFRLTIKAASKEFIKPTAKFRVWLCYDVNDQIIGFYAIQE